MEESFDKYMGNLRFDLEKVLDQIRILVPKYAELKSKSSLSSQEQKELGDLEYILIEMSPMIDQLQKLLKNDLFGNSLDYYYLTKSKAKEGNIKAKEELDRLRKILMTNFFEKEEMLN